MDLNVRTAPSYINSVMVGEKKAGSRVVLTVKAGVCSVTMRQAVGFREIPKAKVEGICPVRYEAKGLNWERWSKRAGERSGLLLMNVLESRTHELAGLFVGRPLQAHRVGLQGGGWSWGGSGPLRACAPGTWLQPP